MKIVWLFIWMVFIPILVLASSITYISYVIFKNSTIQIMLEFYLQYFSIPEDIIFSDYIKNTK